jgi:hypothetical protein
VNRRIKTLAILASASAALAALSATPVVAGPNSGGGKLTATISLDPATQATVSASGQMVSGDATFEVTRRAQAVARALGARLREPAEAQIRR